MQKIWYTIWHANGKVAKALKGILIALLVVGAHFFIEFEDTDDGCRVKISFEQGYEIDEDTDRRISNSLSGVRRLSSQWQYERGLNFVVLEECSTIQAYVFVHDKSVQKLRLVDNESGFTLTQLFINHSLYIMNQKKLKYKN